ncbi:hypothetical protein A2866_00625 [Candidatus Roizmanbacteria bacterium RIFCSPHIGHO2_01_FULL_39_8]|uniref:Bacterial spore germination immunoglobulin-like domain-containing protein n=2 Tax=Candidatus Roizmaniibacteriota TaxID=1752723 RepID=A0A1F7GI66_9BACT|nr:MAG: hypothetical protein A2866_00625 [Candidatus Roizmanbacteria bacterium RIFCSPHIGHO2_01_FULL_39_8]OGK27620.1 MAG: hypothetical protein A3C28_04715 [Candidatus Roizmanbacteria bacterium RIFCSPHIGHO2_02_FULL_39_9]
MKKETVIAVFFGILFGAVVALFLIAKNKEFQFNTTKTIAPSGILNQKAKSNPLVTDILEISEPQNNSIFSTNSVQIKGSAEKNSLIVILSPIKEMIFSNEQKDFSVNFPLALGENVINITVHSRNNRVRPQEKELRIYYLEAEL